MKFNVTKKHLIEITGYIVIGGIGTAVDFGVFFLSQKYLPLVVAQWLAAFAGTVHNQLWHHYKLFTHSKTFWQTLSPVLVLMVATILLSGLFLALLHRVIESLIVCKILLIGVMGGFNFVLRKFWIFQ